MESRAGILTNKHKLKDKFSKTSLASQSDIFKIQFFRKKSKSKSGFKTPRSKFKSKAGSKTPKYKPKTGEINFANLMAKGAVSAVSAKKKKRFMINPDGSFKMFWDHF